MHFKNRELKTLKRAQVVGFLLLQNYNSLFKYSNINRSHYSLNIKSLYIYIFFFFKYFIINLIYLYIFYN